jgi:SprT protein
MHNKKQQFSNALFRFIPDSFVEYVVDLILNAKVKFKIVPGRSTKLGDFRIRSEGEKPIITVNGDLNKFAFLITTLHELAHLNTFRQYGNRVAPHGIEWKNAFRALLEPVLLSKKLPQDLEKALWKSFTNTKASSCSDLNLSRVLRKYDTPSGHISLEEIPMASHFAINGRSFEKGLLRRSRYLCKELKSGKQYLIHALATVQLIKPYEE